MSDKYSVVKCEQYGRRLAARLCDQHFAATPAATLDGPALLAFTPVRQLNLLVLRQLLYAWQAETSRLRSPYFDFEVPAVQAALVEFQNTLSRHIKLNRAALEPLLAQAVAQALELTTAPATAFQRLIPEQSHLTAADLQQGLRYVVLNKEFFERFVATLPQQDLLARAEVWGQLQDYQQSHYRVQQPLSQLVDALSPLLPITEADLREEGPSPATVAALPYHATIPSVTAPINSIALVKASGHTASSTAANAEILPEPSRSLTFPEPASPTPPPLHEKLKAAQPAGAPLAATLRASQFQPTILGEREAPKIETLRDAISINQRFSFINELFNGENMEYHAAIQHLDSLTSLDQARQHVIGTLAQRYDWTRKEEHVTKLLKLVERKLGPTFPIASADK